MTALGGSSLGLSGLLISIKPLADEIANHTANDRNHEVNNVFQRFHLLSVGGARHANYIIFCKTEQYYFKDEALSFVLFYVLISFSVG